MRLIPSLLALGAISLSVPATAGVVFSDGFDAEAGGGSSLNYAAFANFAVDGNVDVVKSGDYGITCSGSCVDLDGSTGPGKITSLAAFAFNAGDKVRLSFDIAGNQRGGSLDDFFMAFALGGPTNLIDIGANLSGVDFIAFPGLSTSIVGISTGGFLNSSDPFRTVSLFFTAAGAGNVKFNIGTNSADNVGPLLDNVKLTVDAGVPEPAAWAMMLAGFGLVGAAMRRREKVAFTFA